MKNATTQIVKVEIASLDIASLETTANSAMNYLKMKI
jgi:hypothetical protein